MYIERRISCFQNIFVPTSSIVQSQSQKRLYSFFTCSIAFFCSAALRARPSTTLAASSSVIPLKTSIGTYSRERKPLTHDRRTRISKKRKDVKTLMIMSGYFSARSSMLVPPLLQAIISYKNRKLRFHSASVLSSNKTSPVPMTEIFIESQLPFYVKRMLNMCGDG